MSRVLKINDKYDEHLVAVDTEEALSKASLKLLRERMEEGWYDEPDPDEPPYSKEQIEGLPEGSSARLVAERELRQWEGSAKQRADERQWWEAVVALLAQPEEEALARTSSIFTGRIHFVEKDGKRRIGSPMEDFPTAWACLHWRSKQGYEYENVQLVEVAGP